MHESFTSHGFHLGDDAEARVIGSEYPILVIDWGGADGHVQFSPADARPGSLPSEGHERFADELVAAAEQYRDAIAGARFWADFDHTPNDAEGAA